MKLLLKCYFVKIIELKESLFSIEAVFDKQICMFWVFFKFETRL